VENCVGAAFDADNEYWSRYSQQHRDLPPPPDQIGGPEAMRTILLRHPWKLSDPSASWLIRLGIGFLRPRLGTPTNLPDLE